jgi:predicted dehydrogenase
VVAGGIERVVFNAELQKPQFRVTMKTSTDGSDVDSSKQVMSRRRCLQLGALALTTPAAITALAGDTTGPKLRAAVIGHTGHGDYGHGLQQIFNGRGGIELVGLADPNPAGRAKVAADIGAPRTYADYRELLEKERPQLVSLAMRHCDQHHEIALAVLRAGAHFYSEKPFVRTPAESDELLAEADRRGLRIAVAHTLRMHPNYVRLKQQLEQGLIGDLMEMRAYGKQDARAGGEDMMVLGVHLFDLMRMFAGDPLWGSSRVLWKGHDITRADARSVPDDVGLVAGDEVFAQFAFPRNVNATFTSAGRLRATVGGWGIELHGSKGIARIVNDVAPNVFVRRDAAWKSEGKTEEWQPLAGGGGPAAPASNAGPVDDWLQAIAQKREPVCSGRNGAWAVEMVMGVYQSALNGRRAQFPLEVRTHPLAA